MEQEENGRAMCQVSLAFPRMQIRGPIFTTGALPVLLEASVRTRVRIRGVSCVGSDWSSGVALVRGASGGRLCCSRY